MPEFQALCEVGRRYRFNYPPEFTTLPDYTAHAGAVVTVLREDTESDVLWDDLGQGEQIVDRMYVVQAEDGWVGHAWHSELEPVQQTVAS